MTAKMLECLVRNVIVWSFDTRIQLSAYSALTRYLGQKQSLIQMDLLHLPLLPTHPWFWADKENDETLGVGMMISIYNLDGRLHASRIFELAAFSHCTVHISRTVWRFPIVSILPAPCKCRDSIIKGRDAGYLHGEILRDGCLFLE